MIQNKLKILGDLEAEIMEIVWETGQGLSVREVLLKLEKKKKIAYTTVMTVMSRLHDKGILKRKKDKTGAFVYLPVQDKKSFLQNASGKIIRSFLKEYGNIAVAKFIDIIETSDPKHSKEWKEQLKGLIK